MKFVSLGSPLKSLQKAIFKKLLIHLKWIQLSALFQKVTHVISGRTIGILYSAKFENFDKIRSIT